MALVLNKDIQLLYHSTNKGKPFLPLFNRIKEKYGAQWIEVQEKNLRAAVNNLMKKITAMSKNMKRDGHKLDPFLNQEFRLPVPKSVQGPVAQSSQLPVTQSAPSDTSQADVFANTQLIPTRDAQNTAVDSIVQKNTPSKPKETVYKPPPCCSVTIKREVAKVEAHYSKQVDKLNNEIAVKSDKLKSKNITTMRNNQAMKRKTKLIDNLRKKYKSLHVKTRKFRTKTKYSKNEQIQDLKEKVSSLRRSKSENIRYYKHERKQHKCRCTPDNCTNLDKVKCLTDKVKELELEIANLNNIIETAADDTIQSKCENDKRSYNTSTRKCFYYMLQNSVPVEKCPPLFKVLSKELTGKEIPDIPSSATVRRFAIELGVLSDVQVGESLTKAENTTLSWDATSVGGKHINEVSIADGMNNLTLSIGELPGGCTKDYVKHIEDSVKNVSEAYSQCFGHDEEIVQTKITSNLSNTLSDRVAVNHCVTKALSENYGKVLTELHCNVHPLDGLALSARKTISATNVKSSCFGNDGAAINVIRAISKLRYKHGSGDPLGFRMFLKRNNLSKKQFPRYVGNRFHVVFCLAASVYQYTEQLLDYLKNWCTISNGLKDALINDLENVEIQQQLQVLGLLGKSITGPWMREMYGNKEKRSHLEVVPLLQEAFRFLQQIKDKPEELQLSQNDAFNIQLEDSTTLQTLKSTPANGALVTELVSGFVKVLERQLKEYLTGSLSNPSPELLHSTKSASIENMQAERVLGSSDNIMRKAPSATPEFVDAKVKSIVNHTLDWINNHENCDQIIKYGIKRGREVKESSKKHAISIEKEITNRLKDKKQARNTRKRNKLERSVKTLLKNGKITNSIVDKFLQDNELTVNDTAHLNDMFMKPEKIMKGKRIEHMWYDKGEEVMYHGLCLKIKKNKADFDITYWSQDQDEEDGEDYKIPLCQLIVDFIYGDLIFV